MITLPERLAVRALNLQGFRSARVTTSVGRLHVLSTAGHGEGPRVVILHGLSANGLHYADLAARLRSAAPAVIAPDLPGHGLSPAPRGGLDPATMERGTLEVLDAITATGPAIVVGNSMGGLAATRYAALRPERVAGLVLVSPGGAPVAAHELEAFLEPFRIRDHAAALRFVDRVCAKPLPAPVRHAVAMGVKARFGHPTLRRLLDMLGPADFLTPADVRGLAMPTLLIWGREERVLPPSHLAFFADHLPPAARVELWDGFGHIGFLEQPTALATRIARFVEGVRGGVAARPSSAPAPAFGGTASTAAA
jgi:pimeloyl-ACP methyl ester carboxylesterase